MMPSLTREASLTVSGASIYSPCRLYFCRPTVYF